MSVFTLFRAGPDSPAVERTPGPEHSLRRTPTTAQLSVVVPSFNERDNVAPLVAGLNAALTGIDAEILYVDDSTDGTADAVRRAAVSSRVPLRVLHRDQPAGGLAGAVTEGIAAARGAYVVVMDGDLQHPPHLVPALYAEAVREGRDLVAASRYLSAGHETGLASAWRRWVSSGSTLLARAVFPRRVGRVSTDPMTGLFCLRRDAVDLDRLHPRGFKILLEVLARHDLDVAEIPFSLDPRHAGQSKASWANGCRFAYQLAGLRLGRMSRFAIVGGLGTAVNLVVMSVGLHVFALHYVVAAVLATEISILHNFLLQERFVFHDRRNGRHGLWSRLAQSLAFNNIETVLRLPLLVLLVSGLGLYSVLTQAITLVLAFVGRFLFVSKVVYRPGRSGAVVALPVVRERSAA